MTTANPLSNCWDLHRNDEKDHTTVQENQIRYTGHLYTDLAAFAKALDVIPHPLFSEPEKRPFTADVNLSSITKNKESSVHEESKTSLFTTEEAKEVTVYSQHSHRFDTYSMRILTFSLANCPKLQIVKFDNCSLDDVQLEMLQSIVTRETNHITSLYLDWNGESSLYPNFAKENVRLKFLSLRSNNINEEDMAALCENVKTNIHLECLNVFGNTITSFQPFAEMLEVNRSLKNLNVSKTGLDDSSLECLVGHIGVYPFPEEELANHSKKQKEFDRLMAKAAKAVVKDPVPPVDSIFQNEEGAWFINKNEVFLRLNISQNNFTSGVDNLKEILEKSVDGFKTVVWGCEMQSSFLKKYASKLQT